MKNHQDRICERIYPVYKGMLSFVHLRQQSGKTVPLCTFYGVHGGTFFFFITQIFSRD